jgi:hypothetical protein
MYETATAPRVAARVAAIDAAAAALARQPAHAASA